MRRNQGSRRFGFTIVELVVCVAVLGVLASVAIPMVSESIARDGPRRAAANLFSDLAQARGYALSGYKAGPAAGWTATSRTINSGIVVLSDHSYGVYVDRNNTLDGDEFLVRQVTLSPPLVITAPAVGDEVRFKQNGTATAGQEFVVTNSALGVTRSVGVSGGGVAWIH